MSYAYFVTSCLISMESLLLISTDIPTLLSFHFVPNSCHIYENKSRQKTYCKSRSNFHCFYPGAHLCLPWGLPLFMAQLYVFWNRRTRNLSNSCLIPDAVENTSLENLYECLPLLISLFVWFHSFVSCSLQFFCEIWKNQPLQFLQGYSIHSNLYVALVQCCESLRL